VLLKEKKKKKILNLLLDFLTPASCNFFYYTRDSTVPQLFLVVTAQLTSFYYDTLIQIIHRKAQT